MFRYLRVLACTAAIAAGAISDGAQNQAAAMQCIHNKFGSGFVATVTWHDMATGNVVKEEDISTGFTSCADSFYKTRTAFVAVKWAEAADAATKVGIFVAASVVGIVAGALSAGVGAAVAGVSEAALATAMAAGATAGEIVFASGAEAGAELGMDPKKHIDLAGIPGHYFEVNLVGTVWDARAEEGDKMDPFDADTPNLELTAFAPFPVHRVPATPDLIVQNATANACAFACVTGAVPGCKGFNFYPNTGMRETVIVDKGQQLTVPLPILPNTCELYSQSSLDASPMVPEVNGANIGVMFYKSIK